MVRLPTIRRDTPPGVSVEPHSRGIPEDGCPYQIPHNRSITWHLHFLERLKAGGRIPAGSDRFIGYTARVHSVISRPGTSHTKWYSRILAEVSRCSAPTATRAPTMARPKMPPSRWTTVPAMALAW